MSYTVTIERQGGGTLFRQTYAGVEWALEGMGRAMQIGEPDTATLWGHDRQPLLCLTRARRVSDGAWTDWHVTYTDAPRTLAAP